MSGAHTTGANHEMRTTLCACLAAILVTSLGCNKTEPPAKAIERTTTAAEPTAADESAKADRALALAPTNGTAPVDSALASLQRSITKNPGKVDFWVMLGRTWVKKARESSDPGYYAHADACARIALAIDPVNRAAIDLQAMVLLNDHKFEEARRVAESVTQARPDDPMAYGTLSDALLELGRFDEAARATQTMVDLKPNLPSYSRASYLAWLQGDSVAAKKYVRLAMDAGGDTRNPEPLAWVLVQAAMIFYGEGDYAGADAGFDRALGTVADFPPALVGKGRIAMAQGDAHAAASLFERAYRASPLAETAWLLGDARAAAGDEQGSQDAYAHVLKEGKQTDSRTLALFLATKNRDADLALKAAEADRATRGDVYSDDAYAWALYRKGRVDQAEQAITHALRLGTKDARLLYHAGAIRIAAGDAKHGRQLVKEALALNPHFDWTGAKEATALVAE
jgi:tetratricopeptide (TPR) repeat protein